MPKYFDNNRPLPFKLVLVTPDQLNNRFVLDELANGGGKLSLGLRFPDFEKDCLGYVLNFEQVESRFVIKDIVEKEALTVDSIADVIAVLLHVSGLTYSAAWHEKFQVLRNRITS